MHDDASQARAGLTCLGDTADSASGAVTKKGVTIVALSAL